MAIEANTTSNGKLTLYGGTEKLEFPYPADQQTNSHDHIEVTFEDWFDSSRGFVGILWMRYGNLPRQSLRHVLHELSEANPKITYHDHGVEGLGDIMYLKELPEGAVRGESYTVWTNPSTE